jgi:TrkA domain protein
VTTLPGATFLAWYQPPPGSPLVDATLESSDIGYRTRLSLVPLHRVWTSIDIPRAETTLHEGDTLIGVGTPENCAAFEELLTG